MRLPPDAADSQILDAVRAWVVALAAEDYAGALVLVEAGPHWTPELLRTVIANYGSIEPMRDGSTYRVTPPGSARGGPPPRHAVARAGDRISVWFDLPLNGEWSDLTATFDVVRRHGGLVLVLDDVHVM
ncbi:MAG TPA: hypothetical protein VGF59_27580 [Bryobacteraceae bacterium]|jgi:hypothetical protein